MPIAEKNAAFWMKPIIFAGRTTEASEEYTVRSIGLVEGASPGQGEEGMPVTCYKQLLASLGCVFLY